MHQVNHAAKRPAMLAMVMVRPRVERTRNSAENMGGLLVVSGESFQWKVETDARHDYGA